MLRHWSQFVPNISTDIRGHEALHHHHQKSAEQEQSLSKASVVTKWTGDHHVLGFAPVQTFLSADSAKVHRSRL